MKIHKLSELNKSNIILMTIIHLLGLLGIFYTFDGKVSGYSWLFGFALYLLTGFSITAGLHRYFSHRSYRTSFFVEVCYTLVSSMAFVGSVLWWTRDHRIHHKYSDTDLDPHDSNKGFFYSHIGWLLLRKNNNLKQINSISVEDIKKNSFLLFQHKFYVYFAVLLGIILPTTLIGVIFNDWLGGFLITSCFRILWTWHCTFLVNSLAHCYGHRSFDSDISPSDSLLVSILSHGEGWHNYHHAYPFDYKAGPSLKQYNPTAWALSSFKKVGLIWDTKEVRIKL